jgi:hypothetical protein
VGGPSYVDARLVVWCTQDNVCRYPKRPSREENLLDVVWNQRVRAESGAEAIALSFLCSAPRSGAL